MDVHFKFCCEAESSESGREGSMGLEEFVLFVIVTRFLKIKT